MPTSAPPTAVVPAAPSAEPEPPAAAPVPDSFLPSLVGPIGLYHLSTAEVGPVDHFGLALHGGQFFHASDFLVEGDTDTRLSGNLSFGFTPLRYLELFGALLTSSNRNERPPEANRLDPELIKSFGDLILGGKGIYPVARGLTLGGELGFLFLSAVSDLAVAPSSTSFWIGPLATYDFRPAYGIPLRLHANVGYYLDNSKNLVDFTGTTIFTREVASFAYGIADSRFRVAVGVDTPLEQLTAPVPMQIFAEYHLEIATDSADPAFVGYTDHTNRDQQWVTFGVRARVFHGLTLDAGFDAAVRSVGYGYGPPLPPYNVIFGVSLPLDVDALKRPVIVTQTVEKEPPPSTGTVSGTVGSTADGKPIGDAVVAFVGRAARGWRPIPTAASRADRCRPVRSTWRSPRRASSRPRSAPRSRWAPSTAVDVALKPKVSTGNVRGKISDAAGHGLSAALRFTGATSYEAHADVGGLYSAALPAGPYKVTVEAPGFPSKDAPLDISAGQDSQLDVTLRPANPDVTLTGQAVVLRVPIKFLPGKPRLTPILKAELEGVVEILSGHPEIRTLRVEAHWSGPKAKAAAKGGAAKALTERQAAVVKDYLVARGAAAERIEAVGRGSEAPLVPNLGPASQKKNRRVELIVVQ